MSSRGALTLAVEVPATTSNLGPGFDAVGMALELCNHFVARVVERPEDATTEVRGYGIDALRGVRETAVHLGMRFAAKEMGRSLPPTALRLDNAVPFGSGLGSSSTALCGGLLLGRLLCGGDDDRDWLLHHACVLEGHPDNAAPCLLGGLVVAALEPRLPRVTALALPPPPGLVCVAVTPELQLATAQMRAALPDAVPLATAVHQGVHAALLGAALARGRLDLLDVATADRLHEDVRGAYIPGFSQVRRAGLDAGALAVPISGAGPTMLALLDGPRQAERVGAAMVAAFGAADIRATARVLLPRLRGAAVVQPKS